MGAKVFFDDELAGARNVFLAVGTGRLHIYDQNPNDRGRGVVHHRGIKADNLRDVWLHLQAQGVSSAKGLREYDTWRYVMVSAPDGVLLQLLNSTIQRPLATSAAGSNPLKSAEFFCEALLGSEVV